MYTFRDSCLLREISLVAHHKTSPHNRTNPIQGRLGVPYHCKGTCSKKPAMGFDKPFLPLPSRKGNNGFPATLPHGRVNP